MMVSSDVGLLDARIEHHLLKMPVADFPSLYTLSEHGLLPIDFLLNWVAYRPLQFISGLLPVGRLGMALVGGILGAGRQ
jgi:hypothetical protein